MTNQKKFKQRVRERMARTGEPYITARQMMEEDESLQGGEPPKRPPASPVVLNRPALLAALATLEGLLDRDERVAARKAGPMTRWISQWRSLAESGRTTPSCWIAPGWEPNEALRMQLYALFAAAEATRLWSRVSRRDDLFGDFVKGLNRPDTPQIQIPPDAHLADLEIMIFPEGIESLILAGRCASLGGKTVLRGNSGCDVEWTPEGAASLIRFECKQRAFAFAGEDPEEWIRRQVAKGSSQRSKDRESAPCHVIFLTGFFPSRVALNITDRLQELLQDPLHHVSRSVDAVGFWRFSCDGDSGKPTVAKGAWLTAEFATRGAVADAVVDALTNPTGSRPPSSSRDARGTL